MFNTSQFNLALFNVPRQIASHIALTTDAVEIITAMLGISETVYLSTSAQEAYSAEASAAQGILLANKAEEEIDSDVRLIGVFLMQADASEAFASSLRIGALIYGTTAAAESIDAQLRVGAAVYPQTAADEAIATNIYVGATVYLGSTAYEIFSAMGSAEATNIYTINIDVTLQPGDTLVIDSDHYVVLHNGENILDKHSGDWLELSRNTRSVQIGSGTPASLKTSILYTERYL